MFEHVSTPSPVDGTLPYSPIISALLPFLDREFGPDVGKLAMLCMMEDLDNRVATTSSGGVLPLRLNADEPLEGEAYLAFGETTHIGKHVLNLSVRRNLTEAAANFFKMLILLDQPEYHQIAVAPIPFTDLGIGLNDRLARAAAPREL